MNGYEITQERQLIRVHYKLRTGNFKVRTEAGRCVDREAARIYVENQLHRYQVTISSVRMAEVLMMRTGRRVLLTIYL